jgi:hypothetical protein
MAISNLPVLTGAALVVDTDAAATAVNVKAGSTVLYEIELDNSANAAASYLKLYNATAPTIGTTVPDFIVFAPAATRISLVLPAGLTFGTGLSYACVTAGGTAGTTPPTSDVIARIVYV